MGGKKYREAAIVPFDVDSIRSRIFVVRGQQAMLDRDLAQLYGVEVKRLTEQVKRNIERFPENFRFQLTQEEVGNLRSQIATSSGHGGSRYLPYVFTEQGVSMLSAVLRSDTAIAVSISIINTFVEMRRFLQGNASVFARMETVERNQLEFENKTDERFKRVFQALESAEPPRQGVFFDGQVFDAHSFVSRIVRKAKASLVLVDNYVDESVLTLFTKRRKDVSVTIYTRKISSRLALDVKKFNEQYPAIEVAEFGKAHDRFLIIDEKEVYHIGASLKDLGKKWFAFSKIEIDAAEMLSKLRARG